MTDYSKCKMYIILDDNWNCYVGHTTMTLKERMECHNTPSNTASSKQLMSNNPIIELLEDYPCNNKREAEHREQYWMDQYPNRVNFQNAIQDRKAMYKTYYKTTGKTWYMANKDRLIRMGVDKTKAKGPYTCECGTVITYASTSSINRHKQSKKHINYNLSQLHKDEPHL